MTSENLFERQFCLRYNELKTLTKSTNELDRLRISAILRLLLLDGLMQNANKKLKMSIRFTTTYRPIPMRPASFALWSILDGLYPDPSLPNSHPITQDLKHFLAKPVAKINKNIITIKDIIKFESNVKGGVHVRNADLKDPIEYNLENFPLRERILENNQIKNYRPSLRQLNTIALVTLDALNPLYNAINNI